MTARPMEQTPQMRRIGGRDPFDVIGGQQFGVQAQPLARRRAHRGMFAPGATLGGGAAAGTQPQISDLRSPIGNVVPMFSGGAELRQQMDEQGRLYAERQSRRREKTRQIVGTIADGLLGYAAGMGNPFAMAQVQNNMAMRRERAQQESADDLYQRRRVDEYEDWVKRQNWELQNKPQGASNDTVADYNFILEKLGPDAANRYLSRQGDPIITTTLPGNRFFSGPSSQLAAALGSSGAPASRGYAKVSPEAIADLKADPSAAAEFDEVFGPGSAARILGQGGQSGSAPAGGFRPAY